MIFLIALGLVALAPPSAQAACTATFSVETGGGGSEPLTAGYDFLLNDVKTVTWLPGGTCAPLTAFRIELYRQATPHDELQWSKDITVNQFTWDKVDRPTGSRDDSYYFKVHFPGAGTTAATSSDFNILRFKITTPTGSEAFDEYGSMEMAWTVYDLQQSESFNLDLLKADNSLCQAINQTPFHGNTYSWSPIQICEGEEEYKIKVALIDGESETTPAFTIRACRISLGSTSTAPSTVHCSSDLDGQVLLNLTLEKDNGPAVDLTSLTFTVSTANGYSDLITGFLQYKIGSGNYQPFTTEITTKTEYTITGLDVPIGSTPTTFTIATRDMDNPLTSSASIALSIVGDDDVLFDYDNGPSDCMGSGAPVSGSNLILDDRRPSPLASIGGAPTEETIWCTLPLDPPHPGTVALLPSFGEAGEEAYSITSITLKHASGVHFDDVSEVAVYHGGTKLLYRTPAQNQTDTIVLDQGTDIQIARGDPESEYQIVYTWKSDPPDSPRTYSPSITGIDTNANGQYCGDADPFGPIKNVPGRSMVRSPSGELAGALQPPNDATTVCAGSEEVLALKVNLSASLQDMDVEGITLKTTGEGGAFSFFSSLRLEVGEWGQQYTPGGGTELILETDGLQVSENGPIPLEVFLTPKATGFATEPSIQIQLLSVSYSGSITGNLPSDPCENDYEFDGSALIGRTLQMRSRPDLVDDNYVDLPDINTCTSELVEVLGFRLSATDYGRESNYPYLSGFAYDLASGSIDDLGEIRLYKAADPDAYVLDEDRDGEFDGVADKLWSLNLQGTQYRLAVLPREDAVDVVELMPRIIRIGAIDPDGCSILDNEPNRTDATLQYKRKAELAVTRVPIQGSGERSVCSAAETEQPMLRLEMVTDGAERVELETLTLSCNLWTGVTTVKAYGEDGPLVATWNATDHRLEFSNPGPMIDSISYPIEIRFVFTNPTLDSGYQATLETGSASGEVTGEPPYDAVCGPISWPAGRLTEPSMLVYRPGGTITRQLTQFPTDWTIPTTTELQPVAKSRLTITSREDISLTSISYGECLAGNRLDEFFSTNAQLWVGPQNLGGTADVGQDIVFTPPSPILIPAGEYRDLELRGAFDFGWNDPGNGTGPKIKISAPMLTAIGSKSGQACQSSIQVDPPSVACPASGWELEKIGTVIIEATSANADTVYCDQEALALGFSLRTSQEETGTLNAVTVTFDDVDNCGPTGRARLVLEDEGRTNGTLDPGEEDNNLSGTSEITGGKATLPLTQPRQLSTSRSYFLVLVEIDYNGGCNNKKLLPHIDRDGISATGHDTAEAMEVDPPSTWQRRITMIQDPAIRASITHGGGDVPMRPGEWSEVYTIGLTALCRPVTATTLDLSTRNGVPNTGDKDIDAMKVVIDGCGLHQEYEYDWLRNSQSDAWSQTIDLPDIPAGCALSAQILLKPLGPSDVDIGDRDVVEVVLSGPLIVPNDTFEAKVLYADEPIVSLCYEGCEVITPDPLVLAPDSPIQEITIARFCLLASALNAGQAFQLNRLKLSWINNTNPSGAYERLICRVDEDVEFGSSVPSPEFTFGSPVTFSRELPSHTFEILAVTKDSGTKSGSHQITLGINSSNLFFTGNPQWSCSQACACDGRVVSFESIASVELCSCSPPGTDEVVWGPEDVLDVFAFTLMRRTTEHSISVEEIVLPLEQGDASLFAGNLDRIQLYELAGGCGGSRTPITSSIPPSYDQQSREITIPLDQEDIRLDDSARRYFVIELTAGSESAFENGDAFHFDLPQATATDLTVQGAASVTPCNGMSPWPPVRPRVAGWADLAGACDKEDTGNLQEWLRFYRLDLKAKKEALTAQDFTFEFEDPTAPDRVDPSKDRIFFALFDEVTRDSLTQHVRWEPGTAKIVFPGFRPGKGVIPLDNAIHQWYLKLQVRNAPSPDNTDKKIEIKNLIFPGNLKFTGSYTAPEDLTVRTGSTPPACAFVFGAARALEVTSGTIDDGSLQPGAAGVPAYRDTARVAIEGLSLQLQSVRYKLVKKPSAEEVLQNLQFSLYRSLNGGAFDHASSGQLIGDEVVFTIDESAWDIPATGFAVFETRVSASDLDTGHDLQLAIQDCNAYVATDVPGTVIPVTCVPSSGPLLTFAPGPCDNSAGRSGFEILPSAVNSGIEFSATIVLRDGSGVLNEHGNAIPGVPLSSLRLVWKYDGDELQLTPSWASEFTDADGKATCSLTVFDQIGDNSTGMLLCSLGQTCTLAATLPILPGRPYAQNCRANGRGEDETEFEVCFVLEDSLRNEINEEHVTIQPGIPDPNPPELANPTQSSIPMCWTYDRSSTPGDVDIPVVIHAKNDAYDDARLLFGGVRVPEFGPPEIDSTPTVTLDDGGKIHVTALTASDANNADADRNAFRAYLLLRKGWSDDAPDSSIVVRNEELKAPSDGVAFTVDHDLPAGVTGAGRSLDWRIAVADRDNNVAYYPPDGFTSITRQISTVEHRPAPSLTAKTDWRFFSIPDSFPDAFPGTPEKVFAEMIATYGNPRQDRWVVADFIGHDGFSYYKREKMGGEELREILSGRGYWVSGAGLGDQTPFLRLRNGRTQLTDAPRSVEVRIADFTAIGNPFNFELKSTALRRSRLRVEEDEYPLFENNDWAPWFALYAPERFQSGSIDEVRYTKFGTQTGYDNLDTWTLGSWGAQYLWVANDSRFGNHETATLVWDPPAAPMYQPSTPQRDDPRVGPLAFSEAGPSDSWRIDLIVGQAHEAGPWNGLVLRARAGASAGLDVLDAPHPPEIDASSGVRLLSMPTEEVPAGAPEKWLPALEIDTRPAETEPQVVDFFLDNRGGVQDIVRISWSAVTMPEGLSARIVDPIDQAVIDVAAASHLDVALLGSVGRHSLRLVVAPESRIEEALSRILPPVPQRTEILPASPNPCQGMTRIRFGVPATAEVSLAIYDVRGHRIRSLLDGIAVPAGFRTEVWDGRNDRGASVAAGIYWARVEASGASRKTQVTVVR